MLAINFLKMSFTNIKSQIVELQVAANSTLQRFTFDTQNFLRLKNIVSLQVYTTNDMTTSPLGNTLPTTANVKGAYLTLYGQNPENTSAQGVWLQQIPLWDMHNLINGVDPYVFDLYTLMPRVIVWEKSYIDTTAVLGNDTALSWVFNVGYCGNQGDN
jgi:hypothetical protein